MDKISIIVPVYNTEKYISKCLDSLINQTYKNIEIIIVNDGSPDNSQNIIDKYVKNYPKIIKSYVKKNGGLSDARNFGLKKVTGDYIGFVDSDDYVENNMYEVLYNLCKKNNSQISVCGWYLVENSKKRKCDFTINEITLNSEECIDKLLDHCSFDNFMCNKLFKKELFLDIEFPVGKLLEDLRTLYKLIYKSNNITISDKPLYYYVLNNESITSNLHRELNTDIINAYKDRMNDLLYLYPNLNNKIKSNYFTSAKMNYEISIKSTNRNKKYEKDRIKDMRNNIKYVFKDSSIPNRVKTTSLFISIFPHLYYKVRGVIKSEIK